MTALAIVSGHVRAVRVHTKMVTRDGHRVTSFVAEVVTPGGTFDIPVTATDDLLNADVEIMVRRLDSSTA